MKIILEAFGKLKSDIIEIPDNSTDVWTIPLEQNKQPIFGYSGNLIDEIPKIEKRGTFRYTGKSYSIDNKFVKVYVLEDIR